jgi:hypothetical protein
MAIHGFQILRVMESVMGLAKKSPLRVVSPS